MCLRCGNCCRVVLGLLPAPVSWTDRETVREWAAARGLRRAPPHDRPGLWGWFIPSICPQMDILTNRCGIYETRPSICRTFDGRTDADLECLWKGEV